VVLRWIQKVLASLKMIRRLGNWEKNQWGNWRTRVYREMERCIRFKQIMQCIIFEVSFLYIESFIHSSTALPVGAAELPYSSRATEIKQVTKLSSCSIHHLSIRCLCRLQFCTTISAIGYNSISVEDICHILVPKGGFGGSATTISNQQPVFSQLIHMHS